MSGGQLIFLPPQARAQQSGEPVPVTMPGSDAPVPVTMPGSGSDAPVLVDMPGSGEPVPVNMPGSAAPVPVDTPAVDQFDDLCAYVECPASSVCQVTTCTLSAGVNAPTVLCSTAVHGCNDGVGCRPRRRPGDLQLRVRVLRGAGAAYVRHGRPSVPKPLYYGPKDLHEPRAGPAGLCWAMHRSAAKLIVEERLSCFCAPSSLFGHERPPDIKLLYTLSCRPLLPRDNTKLRC